MEYLPQVDSPHKESAYQRRLRSQLLVAAGAKLYTRPLFGLDGSGLYLENGQGQVMQV